jgi:hypothetical protein
LGSESSSASRRARQKEQGASIILPARSPSATAQFAPVRARSDEIRAETAFFREDRERVPQRELERASSRGRAITLATPAFQADFALTRRR